MVRVAVVPFDRHTQGSLVAMLARIGAHESRRFAADHLGVALCPEWLGVGWCMRAPHHAGTCLPIPVDYAPKTVQS
jgi:hypothetical protein